MNIIQVSLNQLLQHVIKTCGSHIQSLHMGQIAYIRDCVKRWISQYVDGGLYLENPTLQQSTAQEFFDAHSLLNKHWLPSLNEQ